MPKPYQLINNLLRFRIPHPHPTSITWPLNRRSAVLVLLFIGSNGELRVLLTKRSRGLRSFSGHVSLPGGKADNGNETFETVARRESEEEIGLPQDPYVLQKDYGMKIGNICMNLPHYLSKTFLSVKPIVCFLYNSELEGDIKYSQPLRASKFFGKLNAGETSSIFSIPLSDLVSHLFKWTGYEEEYVDRKEYYYRWGGLKWPLKHYYYPNENVKEVTWLDDIQDLSSGDEEVMEVKCKDVWGLTAKILFDVSSIAHGIITNSNFEFEIGHEDLIYGLYEFGGQLRERNRSEWESFMILNSREAKYSDVIPRFYMEQLKKSSVKY